MPRWDYTHTLAAPGAEAVSEDCRVTLAHDPGADHVTGYTLKGAARAGVRSVEVGGGSSPATDDMHLPTASRSVVLVYAPATPGRRFAQGAFRDENQCFDTEVEVLPADDVMIGDILPMDGGTIQVYAVLTRHDVKLPGVWVHAAGGRDEA